MTACFFNLCNINLDFSKFTFLIDVQSVIYLSIYLFLSCFIVKGEKHLMVYFGFQVFLRPLSYQWTFHVLMTLRYK